MNHISDFMGTFRNGFQRGNRFVCQVLIPPQLVANIIADSVAPAGGGIFDVVDKVLALENSVLAVPQVVKWLAQGYLVSDARLPDRGFGMVDLSMYGITEHFPVHAEYSSMDCTFLMPYATNVSNDNAVPRFFNYWQSQIQRNLNGPDSGFDFKFPGDYYGTILLTALDRKNKGTITYKFDRVYPKTVDTVQMSWADTDKFATLPVSFNFSYWTVLPVVESLALSLVDQALT
jgi:hypothetical protein